MEIRFVYLRTKNHRTIPAPVAKSSGIEVIDEKENIVQKKEGKKTDI